MENLNDVKRYCKENGDVKKIKVYMEEYGEGYNIYVDVFHHTEWRKVRCFTVSEEEKKYRAEPKVKRIVASLEKLGYQVDTFIQN